MTKRLVVKKVTIVESGKRSCNEGVWPIERTNGTRKGKTDQGTWFDRAIHALTNIGGLTTAQAHEVFNNGSFHYEFQSSNPQKFGLRPDEGYGSFILNAEIYGQSKPKRKGGKGGRKESG